MTFLERLELLDRMDGLIRRKATGTADDLAQKLGVSRRSVFDMLTTMKAMDAQISFCNNRKSYYYEESCELMIGFVTKDKIKGGKNIYFSNFDIVQKTCTALL